LSEKNNSYIEGGPQPEPAGASTPARQAQLELQDPVQARLVDLDEEAQKEAQIELEYRGVLAGVAIQGDKKVADKSAEELGEGRTHRELVGASFSPLEADFVTSGEVTDGWIVDKYTELMFRKSGVEPPAHIKGITASIWRLDQIRQARGDKTLEETQAALMGDLREVLNKRQTSWKEIQDAENERIRGLNNIITGKVEKLTPEMLEGIGVANVEKAAKIRRVWEVMRAIREGVESGEAGGVGMEWYRDWVYKAACDENGKLDETSWQLVKMGMIALAEEQKGYEGFGASYRWSSTTQKMLLNMQKAFRDMSDQGEREDRETVLKGLATGGIKEEESEEAGKVLSDEVAREIAAQNIAMAGGGVGYIWQKVPTRESVLQEKRAAIKEGGAKAPSRSEAYEALGRLQNRRGQDEAWRTVAGFMRNCTEEAEEIGGDIGWWKKMWWQVAEMGPMTVPYAISMIPGVGLAGAAVG
ncbi:MAG: hypothetical protein LUE08_07035, partial [Akkermansiaceae bacterium]|nr:hypothetical protein [Akkermansiaceae bacterium]